MEENNINNDLNNSDNMQNNVVQHNTMTQTNENTINTNNDNSNEDININTNTNANINVNTNNNNNNKSNKTVIIVIIVSVVSVLFLLMCIGAGILIKKALSISEDEYYDEYDYLDDYSNYFYYDDYDNDDEDYSYNKEYDSKNNVSELKGDYYILKYNDKWTTKQKKHPSTGKNIEYLETKDGKASIIPDSELEYSYFTRTYKNLDIDKSSDRDEMYEDYRVRISNLISYSANQKLKEISDGIYMCSYEANASYSSEAMREYVIVSKKYNVLITFLCSVKDDHTEYFDYMENIIKDIVITGRKPSINDNTSKITNDITNSITNSVTGNTNNNRNIVD